MAATPDSTVMDVVSRAALTVGMDQLAEEVRAAMNRRGVRFAAVSQGGLVTAVLDRQTLSRELAVPGRRLRVRDVVHPGMACLRPDASTAAAARLMRITGSAAVPVVDEHRRLIGLVTADALANREPREDGGAGAGDRPRNHRSDRPGGTGTNGAGPRLPRALATG